MQGREFLTYMEYLEIIFTINMFCVNNSICRAHFQVYVAFVAYVVTIQGCKNSIDRKKHFIFREGENLRPIAEGCSPGEEWLPIGIVTIPMCM